MFPSKESDKKKIETTDMQPSAESSDESSVEILKTTETPPEVKSVDLVANIEAEILRTITCPVTLAIFRRPAILIGTNEVIELAVAQKLMDTTRKGLDNRPITGYMEIFILNSLIDSYMLRHADAARYPEYARNPQASSAVVHYPSGGVGLFAPTTPVRTQERSNQVYLPQIMVVKPNNSKNKMKVLLIGDSDAGKTTLLQASNNNFLPTIGTDFRIINYKNIKFQCWDTAGQERFRTITNSYYHDVDAIILMSRVGILNYLNDIQNHVGPDYHYYGIHYSERDQISNLTRVINQENPDTFPHRENFTEQAIGTTRSVNWNSEELGALFFSLLDNIKTCATSVNELTPAPIEEARSGFGSRGSMT